jgi:hypothetical protein
MHSLFANSEWTALFLNLFKSVAIRSLLGRIYAFQKDNYWIFDPPEKEKRTNDKRSSNKRLLLP